MRGYWNKEPGLTAEDIRMIAADMTGNPAEIARVKQELYGDK